MEIFFASLAMVFMAIFVIVFIIYYQRRQIQQQINDRKRETQFQQQLLEVALQSTEAERRRIAQDLHDEIGASLSVIKLGMGSLANQLTDAQQRVALTDLRGAMEEAISNVRRISRDLVPITLERFGLSAALQEFAARSNHTAALHITYTHEGQVSLRYSARVELMLYRIAQELVNNAVKHAGAKNIHINFTTLPSNALLEVNDDGRGFVLGEVTSHANRGLGLQGIEARIRVINATVSYNTARGAGCKATIDVKMDTLPTTIP